MPVEVTEHFNAEMYTIRYGIEFVEWYDADSLVEALEILVELSKRGSLLIEWNRVD
jgi:hypothetical protein